MIFLRKKSFEKLFFQTTFYTKNLTPEATAGSS